MKRIITVLFVLLQICFIEGATYYSIGIDPNLTSSWNTNRTGGGDSPLDFASGDIFVIQNGYTMTTSAAWSISGTGSKLWIENGGILVATSACTLATATTFQIDNGGTYKHNNSTASGSTIFAGKESFAAGSTIEILASQSSGLLQSDISFGNIIWNIASGTGNPNLNGGLTNIQGNFEILSTGSSGSLVLTKSDAFSLTIIGDLIISGGTLNLSNGTANAVINLSGNFEMTGGTITETSDGSGTIVFSGSSQQTFTKSSGTISEKINFTINNPTGVILNNPLTIDNKGTLTLTSGNITTTLTNLLTLGASVTISGGSSSSFINGPLAHTDDATTLATKTFPIGKDTYYRPLMLAVTQDAATSTTYTAEIFNVAPTSRTLPGTLDKVSTVRYWNITKGSGANITAAAVTLNYDSDDGVSNYANLRVAKDDGFGNWIDLGGTGTANTSGSITSTTNFTSFSNFVLANASGGANPLPVELSSFTSVVNGNDVVLNWSTATEVNNYRFSVQRASTPLGISSYGAGSVIPSESASGEEGWKEIGFVNGNGNSNCPKEYSFIDNTLSASGTYSYRLKQIDNDGKYEYSNSVEVNFVQANKFNLAQNFPNPFNPVTVINYQLPANSFVTLKVYDLLGKEVATLVNGNMDAGNHNVNFNASSVAAGTYFYELKAGDYTSIKKLMLVK